MTNAFLTFFLTKLCMTLSKFTVFAMSVSMPSQALPSRLDDPSSLWYARSFFISFSLLKDRSAEATVAGSLALSIKYSNQHIHW